MKIGDTDIIQLKLSCVGNVGQYPLKEGTCILEKRENSHICWL